MVLSSSDTVRVFKAFCDINRLKIINMLTKGDKCGNELLEALDVSQPTLSHHMKILCESGIVFSRRYGKLMQYSLSYDGIEIAKNQLIYLQEFAKH